MSAQDTILAKEAELRYNRFESAFAVDAQETILIDKTGEEYAIRFTRAERELLYQANGVTFTHNHPRGWEYPDEDPRRAGSSFSRKILSWRVKQSWPRCVL